MFDPDRFRLVDALFDRALLLPAEEREGFLKEECGEDLELLEEVRGLLISVEASESRFGESVADFAPSLISRMAQEEEDADPPFRPGQILGSWRILGELGRGGMGEVYLAERADDAFQLRAAVKVVKRGMDTAEVLRRFHEERRILATLDHPHIARVLDGGSTEDGRPYLVMEYVEGEPIDSWCDVRKLDVRSRVALFRRVCDAVDQAHRSLIVHRDLKPSNILVNQEGEPKLLDFGIAKLLEVEGDATRTSGRLLTPFYAAPEQRAGLPVTTATDVHGLGRLLYLLLTGVNAVTPVPGTDDDRGDADLPPPPSARVMEGRRGDSGPDASVRAAARGTSPGALRSLLRGDLDTILLRALAPEPERRYPSALQLAEDLDRWLEGLPVRARPDSFSYRAGKFIRRNRGAVTAGTVSILLVLASVVALALAQQRTADALAEAERERDTAEEVVAVLQGIFSAGNPMSMGLERLDTLPVGALLDRSTLRIREELSDRPHLQARLFRTMGDAYRGMGLLEAAEEWLGEAVRLQRGGEGDTPSGARSGAWTVARGSGAGRDGLELGRALHSMGLVALSRDRNPEAEALFREALALRRTLSSEDAMPIASALTNLASSVQNQGRFLEAAELYEEADQILAEAPAPDTALLSGIVQARAVLAQRMGDEATVARMAERTLELDRGILGAEHWRVGLGSVNLGFIRQREGRLEEADSLHQVGLGILASTLGEAHPLYLNSLGGLAHIRARRGMSDEAIALFETAVTGLQGREGPTTNLSIHLSNYADLLEATGDLARAEEVLEESVEVARLQGESSLPHGAASALLALFLCTQDRFEEAEDRYRVALRALDVALEAAHPRVADTRIGLARCLVRMGRPGEGESLLLAHYRALEAEVSPDHPQARSLASELASIYEGWNRPAEAETFRSLSETPPGPPDAPGAPGGAPPPP